MASGPATKRRIVSEVKGIYREFSDGTILLMNVRASYPWITKAQKNEDDDGKVTYSYGVTALMPKDTHGPAMKVCKKFVDMFQAELQAKYPPKPGAKPIRYQSAKKFIKDGNAKDEDGERINGPEAEDMWLVSCRSPEQPLMRGPNIDPETGKVERLTTEEAIKRKYLYGGCYVDLLIRPWAMDNKYGKRANAAPVAIQFRRHGEPFGTGRVKEEDIDDTFDGASDEDTGGFDDDDDDAF